MMSEFTLEAAYGAEVALRTLLKMREKYYSENWYMASILESSEIMM